MSEENEPVRVLPLLPLKNSVLFPHLLMPLSVGRPGSIAAAEAALGTEENEIVIVAQREPSNDAPGFEDLYNVGTRAVIKKMARPSEGQVELIVLGIERVVVLKLEQIEPHIRGRVRPYPLPDEKTPEVEALHRAVTELAAKAISLAQPNVPAELTQGAPLYPAQITAGLLAQCDLTPVPDKSLLLSVFASMVFHADVLHLLFNMVVLWMLGRILERDLGPARFLTAYLLSGLAERGWRTWRDAALIGLLAYLLAGPWIPPTTLLAITRNVGGMVSVV